MRPSHSASQSSIKSWCWICCWRPFFWAQYVSMRNRRAVEVFTSLGNISPPGNWYPRPLNDHIIHPLAKNAIKCCYMTWFPAEITSNFRSTHPMNMTMPAVLVVRGPKMAVPLIWVLWFLLQDTPLCHLSMNGLHFFSHCCFETLLSFMHITLNRLFQHFYVQRFSFHC